MPRIEIEDRRHFTTDNPLSGYVILWEVVLRPLPMRLYRGKFATTKEAKVERSRIIAEGRPCS